MPVGLPLHARALPSKPHLPSSSCVFAPSPKPHMLHRACQGQLRQAPLAPSLFLPDLARMRGRSAKKHGSQVCQAPLAPPLLPARSGKDGSGEHGTGFAGPRPSRHAQRLHAAALAKERERDPLGKGACRRLRLRRTCIFGRRGAGTSAWMGGCMWLEVRGYLQACMCVGQHSGAGSCASSRRCAPPP